MACGIDGVLTSKRKEKPAIIRFICYSTEAPSPSPHANLTSQVADRRFAKYVSSAPFPVAIEK